MSFLSALRFLTVFPIPGREESTGEVGRSSAWFPLAGLIIGLILAGMNWVFSLFLPVGVTNGLTIVLLVLITGAMHLDGFVDTCDGLAGNKSAEERWVVMHDSRAGAFGIVGVVLLLLMKYLLLNSIPQEFVLQTLVLMPVLGRWAMVYSLAGYPYAHKEGLGKAFKEGVSKLRLAVATVITLGVSILLAWWAVLDYYYIAGIATVIIIWLMVLGIAAYFKHKFAGLTGDTYGAINELTETCVLLLVSIAAFNGWIT